MSTSKTSFVVVAVLACVVVGLVGQGTASAQPPPAFEGLGHLPGTTASLASGVSGDGAVVVGYSAQSFDNIGFRWTAQGGMVPVGPLPAGCTSVWPCAASADGSVIVGYALVWNPANHLQAFRWTQVTGVEGLGFGPGGWGSDAASVSADGSVVVGHYGNAHGRYEAALWTPIGGWIGLGFLYPDTGESGAQGVSADGTTVVGFSDNEQGDDEAFRCPATGGMVSLGDLPGGPLASVAYAASADGSVIVGVGSRTGYYDEAVRWGAGGPIGLGRINGYSSRATAVSADGSVVVGASGGAFIWTGDDGMVRLSDLLTGTYGVDLTGWWLAEATGVSADGMTIVGNGIHNGQSEAWIARLCPDRDGDCLCDQWEEWGIDVDGDGEIHEELGDFDLPARGANPDHKDIFIEIDAMAGREPSAAALNAVVNAFAAVPNALVQNPDGANGITLHLEPTEGGLPRADWPNAWAGFDAFKQNWFGTPWERGHANREAILRAKRCVYRYCVFANTHSGGSSSGMGELPGNDFMVTLGHADWQAQLAQPFYQPRLNDVVAGTFMHELGHTLGLRHGGGDHIHHKPNYHSVMNYTWQYPIPAYAASWGLDYSQEAFPGLDEADLDETAGIGGHAGHNVPVGPPPARIVPESGPVDWNRDGDTNDAHVVADGNRIRPALPPSPNELLAGYADWPNLVFRRNANWADGVHVILRGTEADLEEMTADIFVELTEIGPALMPGDLNCDGNVNFADINPFVLALSGPAGYEAAYPNCHWLNGDCNGDGTVNFADINPFVALLSGQ